MTCRKDKGRKCGAGWRNSIFDLTGVAEPKPVITDYKDVVGESYIGCFVDNGKRDLPTLIREGYGNYEKCFTLAFAKKFRYAGLQYSGECWAGNKYGKYGQKDDKECNMPCKKDAGKMCGAGWRNSVFNLDAVKLPKFETAPSLLGETYLGCFVDKGNRDLPKLIKGGYGNYKNCF
jgi:hypothetical protein